jgi:hypothetical protein
MIASYKFWNKFKFESFLNFKAVPSFLEKSDKFSKIPSSHDILEYEFILTHLYSNIESSFTSGNRYLVYCIPYKSWPNWARSVLNWTRSIVLPSS